MFMRILAAGLSLVLLAGNTIQTQAKTVKAPEKDIYREAFDAAYYYNTYPDLQQAIGNNEQKLFEHFTNIGMHEGRTGKADFNLKAYIQNNADLMAAYGEDFSAYVEHYMALGKAEGRSAIKTQESSAVIGTYTTEYDESEQRAINVKLAAERINGTVIQPGDSFSFSKTILPRTTRNGYVMGPAFSAGKEIESIGGGICQVSSTLYVAMILAALPSTERYMHSGIVDYVPLGLDATIAGTAKDLKFTNIFSQPLTILAQVEDGVLTVSLQLGEV